MESHTPSVGKQPRPTFLAHSKMCITCKAVKPRKLFRKKTNRCIECVNKYHAQWLKSNGQDVNAYNRSYYARNREKCIALRTKIRRENPERLRYYENKHRHKLRNEVIDHYGGKCECCGETRRPFLTIEHKNRDGAEHRRQVGQGSILKDIKNKGFPDWIGILCFNCNCATKDGGLCPHKIEKGHV